MNKNGSLLNEIIDYLKNHHQVHTIILYGSRARDEATTTSDYDIIAIRKQGNFERDCQLFKGFYLDAFIYPEKAVKNPDSFMIRIKDGIVLCQNKNVGADLLKKIKKIFKQGPDKTPDWEKHEIFMWLRKMFQRAQMNDVEGHFRMHWLLHDLLECYFKLRDLWYLGPKESFQWLKQHDMICYKAFKEALKPNAKFAAIENLINYVSDSHIDASKYKTYTNTANKRKKVV